MRQTGRTTQMLKAAHAAKEWGSVMIISPNGEIRNSLMKIAGGMGLFSSGVQPLSHSDFTTAHYIMQGKLRGFRGSVFEDHTVHEGAPPLPEYLQEVDMCRAMNQQIQAPKPKTFHFTSF